MKKVSLFYRIRALSFATLVLLSSCGTNLPTKPADSSGDVTVGQPSKPEQTDTAPHKGWFWNPSWWTVNGPAAPEVIGTLQENPWINASAKKNLSDATGRTITENIDLTRVRQFWDNDHGLLNVFLPFTGNETKYGIGMTILPQYNVFGPHTWTIRQVSLTTMFLTNKASSSVSVFSNSVSNSDANFVLSMIQIRSDNSRGLGSMFVIDPVTKVIRNSITTEGIVSIPQLKGLFGNPVYVFNLNPNSTNVTVQAIEKTYIDGSNSTFPVPSSTDTSQKPNCPALKAAADRASAYARQATVALAGGAMVATAVCRESFKSLNFWVVSNW